MKIIFAISIFLILFVGNSTAQDTPKPLRNDRPILDTNEPSASSPFGKLNKDAPAEASQFDFMIGVFDCADEIRNPADGKWYRSKSVWTSSYFLNGYGVQDRYWSPVTVASGTRVFDAKKGKWIVNYFQSQPGYATGVWEGMKEGANMVMRQKNGPVESRLTFSNISQNGYDWIAERVEGEKVTPGGWKISCKRR